MSNLTIAYNGSTIFDGELAGAVTLPTAEKYLEGDIVIAGEGGGTVVSDVLEENEWSVISEVAQAGEGGNYWSIGDAKSVSLNGTVGTLSISTTLYVYIIGINHRSVNGITFQGFKTAVSEGINVCLVDSNYGSTTYSDALWFNMDHYAGHNYGGWAGCDARYDILGSTDKPPSGYGSAATTTRVGYNATSDTATNPKALTLMSCLPASLRAVMQPMTIYTDNKGNSSNTAANVTTSVDYLPLLAEFEVFGARTNANQYEQNNQTQYAYYAAGNSKIKYRHSSTGSTAGWWERSPVYNVYTQYCNIASGGGASKQSSAMSLGLAPMFLV